MRIALFCHSLLSDWNNGHAHFLRGVATELLERGHQLEVFEPADSWSLQNLLQACGESALEGFHAAYPQLTSRRYDPAELDLDRVLAGLDLVIVHEWNDPRLVAAIGRRRDRHGYRLLFHDTHHRAVTDPDGMAAYDLSAYDGVLAFGGVLRDLYLRRGWAHRAWTWHEAADARVFRPQRGRVTEGDLVWIGNWGDEERTAELEEYLLEPVRTLGLRAKVYGVRYPAEALAALERAGIAYGGWLPNYRVPEVFARYRVTVHVPRGPYAQALPGIPTIRPFEALACAIPLVSAPWSDAEDLFTPGRDFLQAASGEEMKEHLALLLNDAGKARRQAQHGLRTVRERHTCSLRVDALLAIYHELVSGVPVAQREEEVTR